jgi:predicted short-subunit dehydrogenase-like oxidoreductase (DUF2520 family)
LLVYYDRTIRSLSGYDFPVILYISEKMQMEGLNISFAGAGRVADALIKKMYQCGFNIQHVVSQNELNGQRLARSYGAEWKPDLIFSDLANVIIVAVPDHILKNVLENIECAEDTIVVHTAGSLGLEVFPCRIKHKGVFYPLQTFSKDREVDFIDLPFFIETSDQKSHELLVKIIDTFGSKAYMINTEKRKMLHLSAVFVNNFTNHLLTRAREIIINENLPFDIFYPLIKETFSKAISQGPENAQTGPAIRNDMNIIETHLDLLSFYPDSQKIYREITQSIINYYKEKV